MFGVGACSAAARPVGIRNKFQLRRSRKERKRRAANASRNQDLLEQAGVMMEETAEEKACYIRGRSSV